tara:strand:- start:1751 stop:1858 length:108 start_codon:yes stop_codon:yes gene_type:complete
MKNRHIIVILNLVQDPSPSSSHQMLKQVQHDEVYL